MDYGLTNLRVVFIYKIKTINLYENSSNKL